MADIVNEQDRYTMYAYSKSGVREQRQELSALQNPWLSVATLMLYCCVLYIWLAAGYTAQSVWFNYSWKVGVAEVWLLRSFSSCAVDPMLRGL